MKKTVSLTCLLLFAMFTLTSCMTEDEWTENVLSSRSWRVVEVEGFNSPYRYGDQFYFYNDGSFEFVGYNLHDYGRWRVRNEKLQLQFNNSGFAVDLEAPIPILDHDYVMLDCYDYMLNTSYRLRLIAEHDLSGYGYDNWYTRKRKK